MHKPLITGWLIKATWSLFLLFLISMLAGLLIKEIKEHDDFQLSLSDFTRNPMIGMMVIALLLLISQLLQLYLIK